VNGERRDWRIYTGSGMPHDGISRLPDPPPWRRFSVATVRSASRAEAEAVQLGDNRGATYRAAPVVVDAVNTAMYLRRPLLVTGPPGTGKSTLAYSVAAELRLGRVLSWSITSRSTLAEGLYSYDAIGRLQDLNLASSLRREEPQPDIGSYLRLGPLGTAFLPWERPRVLLVDELDKSDIDLPNDLLTLFEEGRFVVPELARLSERDVMVLTADDLGSAVVSSGIVACSDFPLVIITSNGEREFPAPFLRRCIRVDLAQPTAVQIAAIVEAHLGQEASVKSYELIEQFLQRRDRRVLATDQLLNAVYLSSALGRQELFDDWLELVLRPLSGS